MEHSLFQSHLDDLISTLEQANALLTVATTIDITELTPHTVLNYLWATSNIVAEAKGICEKLVNGIRD
ncbi:MAG: hypothetical protein EPO11_06710 [Gammaproteobacteria bacterium]|nr:MAG: hypothetical protein EPO11_06710 [Gammaproteobacteria bacterium]